MSLWGSLRAGDPPSHSGRASADANRSDRNRPVVNNVATEMQGGSSRNARDVLGDVSFSYLRRQVVPKRAEPNSRAGRSSLGTTEVNVIRATALLVVAFLFVVEPAASKELQKAELCGSSGCVRLLDLRPLAGVGPDGLWSDEPAAPSPYYRLELYFAGHRAHLYWVPAVSKVAGSSDRGMTWQDVSTAVSHALQDASRDVRPFPVPAIDAARLGPDELPGDPNRYLGVFRDAQGTGTLEGERLGLDFYSNQRSPWTDGPVDYYPDSNSLRFGLSMVRISDQDAALLEGSDDGFPSRVVLGLLVFAVIGIAVAAAMRAGAHRLRAGTSATAGAVPPPSDRGAA